MVRKIIHVGLFLKCKIKNLETRIGADTQTML